MRIARTDSPLTSIPVDFRGDPDGNWNWDELVLAAGFSEHTGDLAVGVLLSAFDGFPEGSAVITLTESDYCRIALADCCATPAEDKLIAA